VKESLFSKNRSRAQEGDKIAKNPYSELKKEGKVMATPGGRSSVFEEAEKRGHLYAEWFGVQKKAGLGKTRTHGRNDGEKVES